MKGFADYLIAQCNGIEREMTRETLGVEAPLSLDGFAKWMEGKAKPSTIKSYCSYIRSLDKNLIVSSNFEEDFYYNLKCAFDNADFGLLKRSIDSYEEEIDGWLKWAKETNDREITYSHVGDMKSAFGWYKEFLKELASRMSEFQGQEKAEYTPKAPKILFAEQQFCDWLAGNGIKGNSAASIVSRVKTLIRDLIDKRLAVQFNNAEITFHYILLRVLKEASGRIPEYLTKICNRVDDAVKNPDATGMNPVTLRNMQSAFLHYVRFIDDYIIEHDLDEEQAETMPEEKDIWQIHGETECYEQGTLRENFRFRILTQDRMSESKELFMPIRLIKRLFEANKKLSKRVPGEVANANRLWLNTWVDECIDGIIVLTDKGEYKFSDISAIKIAPQSKTVTVTLHDGGEAVMMTETESGGKERMAASALRAIHIDHTPLIADVLAANAQKLTAFAQFTEIIRRQAKQKGITITTRKFSKLSAAVFENETLFEELETLVPQLKVDLNLIKEKSTLKLMSAKHNLKKKK